MNTLTNPPEVPPFQLQSILSTVFEEELDVSRKSKDTTTPCITSAQALGTEIYIGCSNGELLRFGLEADDPTKLESYTLLSRQSIPTTKSIDQIIILPSLSRLLVQSDHQIHFFTLPTLDPVNIKPIRNVLTFAVDNRHLQRPPIPTNDPVEFSVIKRNGIAMFSLRNDRLFYQKEIPLPPDSQPAITARRTGHALCFCDNEMYSLVDLEAASLFPLLPLRQVSDPTSFDVKPIINVIGDSEFLILSWTGTSVLGLFITGEGDPVRGTLEWASYPKAVCLDYPYITSLLPNETIEVHNIETQAITQVINAPPEMSSVKRLDLIASTHGYVVQSSERVGKLKKVKVKLNRGAQE